MKEILDDIYQHCLGMQKLAERKNVGIIGFNIIVSLTIIYLLQTGLQSYVQYFLLFVLACSIISIFRVCSAISAQLKRKEVGAPDQVNQNLLFFGSAAKYAPEDYLNELHKAYGNNEVLTNFQRDRSRQIVVVAQIALRKFKLFNAAFMWTIAAIATPVSVIVYFMLFDNIA